MVLKLKKLITFLSVLALTCMCAACSWATSNASSIEEPISSSSSFVEPDDADDLDDPDEPGAGETVTSNGELKCGISMYHGNQWFWKDFNNIKGLYRFGACLNSAYDRQWVYIPYVADNNVLTFDIFADVKQHKIHDGAFKLGYNGAVYSYNAEDNKWYDENGAQGNIQMTNDKGEDVDFSSLKFKINWPTTTFTITGVTTDVEIIFDFDKCDTSTETIWPSIFGEIYKINWSIEGSDV